MFGHQILIPSLLCFVKPSQPSMPLACPLPLPLYCPPCLIAKEHGISTPMQASQMPLLIKMAIFYSEFCATSLRGRLVKFKFHRGHHLEVHEIMLRSIEHFWSADKPTDTAIEEVTATIQSLDKAKTDRAESAIKLACGELGKYMCRTKKEQNKAISLIGKPSKHASNNSRKKSHLRQVSEYLRLTRASLKIAPLQIAALGLTGLARQQTRQKHPKAAKVAPILQEEVEEEDLQQPSSPEQETQDYERERNRRIALNQTKMNQLEIPKLSREVRSVPFCPSAARAYNQKQSTALHPAIKPSLIVIKVSRSTPCLHWQARGRDF